MTADHRHLKMSMLLTPGDTAALNAPSVVSGVARGGGGGGGTGAMASPNFW